MLGADQIFASDGFGLLPTTGEYGLALGWAHRHAELRLNIHESCDAKQCRIEFMFSPKEARAVIIISKDGEKLLRLLDSYLGRKSTTYKMGVNQP